jgi:hypothetical protein
MDFWSRSRAVRSKNRMTAPPAVVLPPPENRKPTQDDVRDPLLLLTFPSMCNFHRESPKVVGRLSHTLEPLNAWIESIFDARKFRNACISLEVRAQSKKRQVFMKINNLHRQLFLCSLHVACFDFVA